LFQIFKIYIYIKRSHGDFSNFQKTIFKDCPHIAWLLFSTSPPTTHYRRDSLSTHELSTKVLGIILKGVSYRQLVDEHDA
jgi:hypothetical protein